MDSSKQASPTNAPQQQHDSNIDSSKQASTSDASQQHDSKADSSKQASTSDASQQHDSKPDSSKQASTSDASQQHDSNIDSSKQASTSDASQQHDSNIDSSKQASASDASQQHDSKKIVIKRERKKTNSKKKKMPLPNPTENPFEKARSEMHVFLETIDEKDTKTESTAPSQSKGLAEGTIVAVTENSVYLDLGQKSEGKVGLDEFTEPPKVGDVIQVMITHSEDSDGNLGLSKRKADLLNAIVVVEKAYEEKATVQGLVARAVKGGYEVNVHGIRSFLPGSQADTRRTLDPKALVGKTFDFRIERFEKIRGGCNLVVSRRSLLEEEREVKRATFYEEHIVGQIVTGQVRGILDTGVFVDLGALDGFIPIQDLSWDRIRHPRDAVEIGQEIPSTITAIDQTRNRVSLSVKGLSDDPFQEFIQEHNPGDRITGIVTGVADYGAFVRVHEGIEGLIHISQMSWDRSLSHPKQLLSRGDTTECQIIDVDQERRRLSLGLRQLLPNPWNKFEEECPIGSTVKGTVVDLAGPGITVKLNDTINAFLPSREVSWKKGRIDPTEIYKIGDEIEASILEIDRRRRRVVLGRRQLEDNPYLTFAQNNPPRKTTVEGEVIRILPIGAIVQINPDIEGFLHISQISQKRIEKVEDALKIGEKITALIVDIDVKKSKVSLSIREYHTHTERQAVEKYTSTGNMSDPSSASLGSFFTNSLKDDLKS